jgi:hypothetical protein
MLPNFIVVGAAKAGTTSLYHYLAEHPEVYMSPEKEPNFFSKEEIESQNLYYKKKNINTIEEYKKLFCEAKNEKAVGEASVSYLYYPFVPQKIKNFIPDARIIISLRNPFERAFSHYLMDLRLGYINISFEDVVYKRVEHKYLNLYYQQYVELGFYFEQVRRYIKCFGEDQVKIILFEDLKNKPKETISNLYRFLDVKENFLPHFESRHNVFKLPKNRLFSRIYSIHGLRKVISSLMSGKLKERINNIFCNTKRPIINLKTKEFLLSLYFNDIEKLETLIERDLRNWKY